MARCRRFRASRSPSGRGEPPTVHRRFTGRSREGSNRRLLRPYLALTHARTAAHARPPPDGGGNLRRLPRADRTARSAPLRARPAGPPRLRDLPAPPRAPARAPTRPPEIAHSSHPGAPDDAEERPDLYAHATPWVAHFPAATVISTHGQRRSESRSSIAASRTGSRWRAKRSRAFATDLRSRYAARTADPSPTMWGRPALGSTAVRLADGTRISWQRGEWSVSREREVRFDEVAPS